MGESPEIPIPMPEVPPPSDTPLTSFFPFGVVLHVILSFVDFIYEGRFWPEWADKEAKNLFEFFPFGPPAQMIILVIDVTYKIVTGIW